MSVPDEPPKKLFIWILPKVGGFCLWEKWEMQEDFKNYNSIPERLEDVKFIQTFSAGMAGPPSIVVVG